MKLGIMGGTFNPIHNAHLFVAQCALEAMELDEVVFVPAAMPPHKEVEYSISPEQRLEMVRIATEGNTRFTVSDIEMKLPRPSYSIKTIEHIIETRADRNLKLYFVMGMDSFMDLDTWHASERIIKLCDIITAFRPGAPCGLLTKHRYVREVNVVTLDRLVSGELKIGSIELVSGRRLWLISTPSMDISSTDIRERVKARKSVKYLLPERVESYIMEHRLYH